MMSMASKSQINGNMDIGGATSRSAPQIFEYSMVMGIIKVFIVKTEVKTALITFDNQVYAHINLTCAYDFAGELLKKASAKWERQDASHYPNPFKTLRQDKQAFEKLQQILAQIYFSGE